MSTGLRKSGRSADGEREQKDQGDQVSGPASWTRSTELARLVRFQPERWNIWRAHPIKVI